VSDQTSREDVIVVILNTAKNPSVSLPASTAVSPWLQITNWSAGDLARAGRNYAGFFAALRMTGIAQSSKVWLME
jgi:hypothetical protein